MKAHQFCADQHSIYGCTPVPADHLPLSRGVLPHTAVLRHGHLDDAAICQTAYAAGGRACDRKHLALLLALLLAHLLANLRHAQADERARWLVATTRPRLGELPALAHAVLRAGQKGPAGVAVPRKRASASVGGLHPRGEGRRVKLRQGVEMDGARVAPRHNEVAARREEQRQYAIALTSGRGAGDSGHSKGVELGKASGRAIVLEVGAPERAPAVEGAAQQVDALAPAQSARQRRQRPLDGERHDPMRVRQRLHRRAALQGPDTHGAALAARSRPHGIGGAAARIVISASIGRLRGQGDAHGFVLPQSRTAG
mmetsp:Transcript_47253/g.156627  ORF Transcript_47253/g.156627 Transcript_47253/m.156627 type:complete len:313 (+) Transcript_47253:103-1041(+)